jgi:hypothetical protein
MAGEDGPTLMHCTGKTRMAGKVTGRPTLKACASKRKADVAHMSGWMNACTSKKKAEEEDEAPENVSTEFMVARGDALEAPTKVMMLMAHEDIQSILSHKARGDSFKEFQASVAKEVDETGEFVVSEEHLKNMLEARDWMREEMTNLRSDYPDVVFED